MKDLNTVQDTSLFCIYRYGVISKRIYAEGNDCLDKTQFEEEVLTTLLQVHSAYDIFIADKPALH